MGLYLLTSDYQYFLLIINLSAYCCEHECSYSGGHLFPNDDQIKMIYCNEEELSEQNKQHKNGHQAKAVLFVVIFLENDFTPMASFVECKLKLNCKIW